MSGTKNSRFVVPWLGTAFAATVAAAVPATALAQTADAAVERISGDTGSSDVATASTGAAESDSAGPGASRGLYVRAGAVLDWTRMARFLDENCSSSSPLALYGCGAGNDGTPRSSFGDFGTMAGAEFGLGYAAAPGLRLESIFQYFSPFSFEGRANFVQTMERQQVSVDVSFLTGMGTAYLDLPELGLPSLGPFRPFAGAGGGFSRIDLDETHMEFPKTTTIVPGGRRINFAWMLTAGVGVSPAEKTTLDLAWRYADYGDVGTDRGPGQVVWRDGSREPLGLDLGRTRANLQGQELSISLRRAF